MTGPEHYAEAEKIILTVQNRDIPADAAAAIAAVAQVHATLAAAAAYADVNPTSAWHDVAGRATP